MPLYYHEATGFADNEAFYRALRSVWNKGKYVGANKPVARAYVRTVRLERKWRKVDADEVFGFVPGGVSEGIGPRRVYKGIWVAHDAWRALPQVRQFRVEQDYDQNGVAQGTIDVDNVFMEEHGSGPSLYHLIKRGYFAPLRGYSPPGRKAAGEQNDWFDVLRDKSTQVILLAGYGELVVPVFTGLINDSDSSSRPDILTLTCRDSGQAYTDQAVFLAAKPRHIADPITFADRRSAYKGELTGHGADASSHVPEHGPRFVLDFDSKTEWISEGNDHKGAMEWVEIKLKHGYYDSFGIHAKYPDMEMWVAIKPHDKNAPGNHGAQKKIIGTRYQDGGWVDEGNGNIPGTDVPFVKHVDNLKAKRHEVLLPDWGYILGDNSRIRLYFSNLPLRSFKGRRSHRAGVVSFHGVERDVKREPEKEEWILVDDVADMVKMVFQWCGLNSMAVESTGVRLKEPVVFNRGNKLLDIVKGAAEEVNYIFYVLPPPSFDESDLSQRDWESMGTGVFRQNQAMKKDDGVIDPVEYVKEDQVLTGVNVKFSDEPLAYNIRVRGKVISSKKLRRKFGRKLGEDRTKRWMYVYRPPWSRDEEPGGNWPSTGRDEFRNGNIKKYVVHYDNKLKSLDECKIAALFIAFAEALASAQCQIEFPAMPTIYLDHQTALFDVGTGLSTRLWIASRSLEFLSGENGHFNMSLGGSLLDTPDIQRVRKELVQALRDGGYNPGLSQWQLDHYGNIYRNAP